MVWCEQRYKALVLAWTNDEDQDHGDDLDADERRGGDKVRDERGGNDKGGADKERDEFGEDKRVGGLDFSPLPSWSRPWLWASLSWGDIFTWGLIYGLFQGWWWLTLWLHQHHHHYYQHKGSGLAVWWADTQPPSHPHKSFLSMESKINQAQSSHLPSTITSTLPSTTTLSIPLTLAYIVSGVLMDGMTWLGPLLLR